jgi:hypothetical protein
MIRVGPLLALGLLNLFVQVGLLLVLLGCFLLGLFEYVHVRLSLKESSPHSSSRDSIHGEQERSGCKPSERRSRPRTLTSCFFFSSSSRSLATFLNWT